MIKIITPQDRRYFAQPKQDQLVMRCEPLAIVLFKEFRANHCNYCLQGSQTNRCSICKQYFYCSVSCQKNDWKQHKIECQLLSKINKEMPCNMLILIRLFQNNIDTVNKIFIIIYLYNFIQIQQINIIQNFYGDVDKNIDQQTYQQFFDCAAYIVKIGQLDNESFGKLMSIQVKIHLNTFTVTDINGDTLGIALYIIKYNKFDYTPANFLNHKCIKTSSKQKNVANCSHFFNQRQLIITTNNSFIQNENDPQELCISYGNIINLKDRQKFLQQQYGFICDCDRCQQEQTDTNNQEELDQLNLKQQEYLTLLNQQKFKKAFLILEEIIVLMPKYYDNDKHPYIGWKMNEASKLGFHLNYLLKAENYSIQAIKLLEPYYLENEQFKELLGRLKDIKAEIKMQK